MFVATRKSLLSSDSHAPTAGLIGMVSIVAGGLGVAFAMTLVQGVLFHLLQTGLH